MNDNVIGHHAVVLGGGMAGLLAARVLTDAYNRVTVVDRDELSASAEPRRGVPQGRHIHGLIARGQQALDELFPGFTDDLAACGIPTVDQLRDARLYFSGHRFAQAASGVVVLSASRPCLEAHVRDRVRSLPGVIFADGRDILGLVSTPDRRRVIGARLIPRADGGTEETMQADLVVDASGRGSRLPLWLEALGYGRPDEEKVSAGVAYATGIFRLRPGALGEDRAIITAPTPSCVRGAGLAVIEGQRHIVTLMGMLGDRRRPTSPASETSPSRCGSSTSTTRSSTRIRPTNSSGSACRRASGAAMSACGASRTACMSWATASAASTRSMGRA